MTTTPEMRLEVVAMPVTDVDRARDFYAQQIGFNLDFDTYPTENVRVVQLTPPGSGCSIVMGVGLDAISEMKPGSIKGLHLVVKNVPEVRDLLISRGVEVSDIVDYGRGIRSAFFSDPDGNSWELQEIPPGL